MYEYKPIVQNNSVRFEYKKFYNTLEMYAGMSWGLYLENSVYLFIKAFNRIRASLRNDFVMNIALTDNLEDLPNDVQYYGFGTSNPDYYDYIIPSPFFVNWKTCKIDDYDVVTQKIYDEGQKEPIYNQCFWAGNLKSDYTRSILYEKFKDNPNFVLKDVSYEFKGFGVPQEEDPYVPMPEQTKYKYIIDIRGHGWSGRLPYTMFYNRPIFYAARETIGHFERDLQPYVHYIPVEHDLSDLEEKYQWAEANYEQAKQIAQNALNYAQKNLKQDSVIDYYSKKILECAALAEKNE